MNPLPLVAIAGNPNAGKSALFNALTGARQKVGNYPGVTVERKSGRLTLADGRPVEVVDLPGSYSLDPVSPDEAVTRDVLLGRQKGERQPDALLIVLDASNLDNHLRFALQLIDLGLPTVVALNMVDLARRDGLELDQARLEQELGVPVIETVAVRRRGLPELQAALDDMLSAPRCGLHVAVKSDLIHLQQRAREIASAAVVSETPVRRWTHRLDAVLLHPIIGPIILAAIMFLMFQAVFSWSAAPVAWIADGVAWLSDTIGGLLPAGLLRSMVVDGAIAGVGAVITFLPQILILFFFILLLEGTGYMVRAAFLMDKLMHGAGLSGRAFIPLLSSFACAVPGIMATRTIEDPKDRLTTILVAPLMTCSARLPVYTLIIAAFIPNRRLMFGVGLQGLVMFGLYIAGITGALLAALVLRRGVLKGSSGGFMMELPKYQLPSAKDVALGLVSRAQIFLKRAGTIILGTTIVLWALASIPQAASRPEAERNLDRRPYRQRHRDRGAADRLQSRHRHGAASDHGSARGRGELDRDDLFDQLAGREGRRQQPRGQAPPRLAFADRARLPRLVRVRAAVHLDDRRHAARDQRLEVAAFHGHLSVRRWPTLLPARPTGRRSRSAYSCPSILGRDTWQAA